MDLSENERKNDRRDWTHAFNTHFLLHKKAVKEGNWSDSKEEVLNLLDCFDDVYYEEPYLEVLGEEAQKCYNDLVEILSGNWLGKMKKSGEISNNKLCKFEIDEKIVSKESLNQKLNDAIDRGDIINILKYEEILKYRNYNRDISYIAKNGKYNGKFIVACSKAKTTCKTVKKQEQER